MAPASGSPHRYPVNQRDEAFDRVRRTTRWVVASAVLGTGALVGVVAQELPAHSANATSTTGSAGTSKAASGTSRTGSASTGTGSSSTSNAGSSTAGSTTGTGSTSGSSVSEGTHQSAHAVTGQS